jgi:protocatechuate 3,4-dioxygenase beta subunit
MVRALGIFGGAAVTVGCGDNASPTSPTTPTTTTGSSTETPTPASACTGRIPNETAGPYPGDGTNGPNVLVTGGVVRSDIRSSFGGMSGTATGVPLTVILRLVSATTCQPLAGYALYLWHCTRDGGYSLYNAGFTNQNYLRGIQEADASGQVTFQTIYPGCYSGRWPHIHFEVFPNLGASSSSASKVATSQLALPRAQNDEVYATTGYESSARNQANITLASDNVFSDGYALELATVTGSVAGGYTALLTVAV